MSRFNTLILSLMVVAGGTAGCADAPSRIGQVEADPALAGTVGSLGHDDWVSAKAGCEDEDFGALDLYVIEEEPSLGALVGAAGEVVCVDSLDLLFEELGLAGADPTPQPSHPGRPDADPMEDASVPESMRSGQVYLFSTDGTRSDPTPTPLVQADLRTSPVELGFELIADVFVDGDGEEEDPTPTPTTEQ